MRIIHKFELMIIEFSVENYRSIKELQTLNMSAANIVSKYKEIDTRNVLSISKKLSLLKSRALYGANASGKSNIIKALVSFISIVHNSVKDEKILDERIEKHERGESQTFSLEEALKRIREK